MTTRFGRGASLRRGFRPVALLLCCAVLAGCSDLLFYPERGLPLTPDRAGIAYRDVQIAAADGTALHAWWLPVAEPAAVKGTVLFLHGNGGNLAWHLPGVYWLPQQGYQVLMLDYRGYGLSEGEPTLAGIYADIAGAFTWLDQAPEVRGKPQFVLGQSLGGALAVQFLAQHPARAAQLRALAIDGAPASYREVGRHLLAGSWLTWALQVPLAWFVPDDDSAQMAIGQLKAPPLLIFHSLEDKVVPFSSGHRLQQAATVSNALVPTYGAHVHTFNEPRWRDLLTAFFADPQRIVSELSAAIPFDVESDK